ncbi:MAG: ATP-binding protein, partial [Thermoanaerobaculia bacterium]|nr:ATP-binding protein [Thermoanaerobaculia bacterium]
ERARAAVPTADLTLDDIPFLLETFDNALSALSGEPGSEVGDIHVLGRALTPSVDCGLLIVNRAGRILALNQQGSELLGIEASVQGQDYDRALANRPELVSLIAAHLGSADDESQEELELELPDGPLTLGIAAHELRRPGRDPQGLLFLFADRTQVRHREEQDRLSRSLAQMGELTAGIAHEMRNSLTSLRGFLSLAERRASGDELREELGEMRREADHLQRILDDFLSFARPGSVRMSEVRLETVVERAAADPHLGAVGVVLESPHRDDEGPRIWGDEQLLERAVRNLLHNAVDAQAEAGRTSERPRVEIAYDEGGVILRVSDRGPGVAAEMEDKIFVPFSTHKPTGVGLGLALARRIVELHGGSLELTNREGGGATATLSFPRSSRVDVGSSKAPSAAPTATYRKD